MVHLDLLVHHKEIHHFTVPVAVPVEIPLVAVVVAVVVVRLVIIWVHQQDNDNPQYKQDKEDVIKIIMVKMGNNKVKHHVAIVQQEEDEVAKESIENHEEHKHQQIQDHHVKNMIHLDLHSLYHKLFQMMNNQIKKKITMETKIKEKMIMKMMMHTTTIMSIITISKIEMKKRKTICTI